MDSLSQHFKTHNLNQILKMLERKSQLNPNAPPYIPISKIPPPKPPKIDEITKPTENSESNQNYNDLGLTPESFSNLVISEDFEDIFHDEMCEANQPNLIIESLGLMFPNTSMSCIEEVLKLNHFDLGQTLSMLDELENNEFEDASSSFDNPK